MNHTLQATGLFVLIIAEILLISFSVDARSLQNNGDNYWIGWLAYSGDSIKIILLTATLAGLAINRRLLNYGKQLLALQKPRRLIFTALQLLTYCLFYYLTIELFNSGDSHTTPLFASGWLATGIGCGLLWLAALAPVTFWKQLFCTEKLPFTVSLVIACIAFAASQSTAELWGPFSEATFYVSATLLDLTGFEIIVDIDSRSLGVGDFVVNIAPSCSGYEGIGLICAFTSVYLYFFRAEFRFPRALLLFPIGIVCIWLLNAVRIAILILIGDYWSPEIAIGGFHSQAGWLTFILSTLGLLYLAHSHHFFAYQSVKKSRSRQLTLAMATLIPVLALLAGNLVVGAFSADFDTLYPIKAILIAVAIGYCWQHLELAPLQLRLEPVLAGVLVAVLWFLLIPADEEYNLFFRDSLDEAPTWTSVCWLAVRALGAIILVPIAEELGFRAYLLCKLAGQDVITRGAIAFSLWPVLVSSLLFGLLHNAWIAGTVAGLVYAIVRIRSNSVTDAMVAHGLTNALLFATALCFDTWHLL